MYPTASPCCAPLCFAPSVRKETKGRTGEERLLLKRSRRAGDARNRASEWPRTRRLLLCCSSRCLHHLPPSGAIPSPILCLYANAGYRSSCPTTQVPFVGGLAKPLLRLWLAWSACLGSTPAVPDRSSPSRLVCLLRGPGLVVRARSQFPVRP